MYTAGFSFWFSLCSTPAFCFLRSAFFFFARFSFVCPDVWERNHIAEESLFPNLIPRPANTPRSFTPDFPGPARAIAVLWSRRRRSIRIRNSRTRPRGARPQSCPQHPSIGAACPACQSVSLLQSTVSGCCLDPVLESESWRLTAGQRIAENYHCQTKRGLGFHSSLYAA